ncbi:v-SNARE family protein [Heterostelium album PN500]|uniref:V-SNARE family protein n=1 Tax=Heterostelium pallidum (strain ATCC 26659 / Pp 5 / PN500) TaxID=670386 RepID=D3BC06_HETP5|nr:v-SNARE family protein [Heterostelium album PN500]EFA81189.1 v-SNARE family protein [Heterostelium album PN500]|eukprot:XP_020433307.1 v-SNARE family protein [Heterostelium album PN500]
MYQNNNNSYNGYINDNSNGGGSSSHYSTSSSSNVSTPNTIEELYKVANKLLFKIGSDLETIEMGVDTTVITQQKLSADINQLSRFADQLDGMVSNESPAKRDIWRIKVKEMTDECKSLRKSMEMYLHRTYKKQIEDEERSKLFSRRKDNQNSALGNLMKENDLLKDSNLVMDELTESGTNIIYALANQNSKLKSVHKKIYDIANTLGLSRNIMNKIRRRQHQDKIIVYGGMVVVLIFLGLMYYYFRA